MNTSFCYSDNKKSAKRVTTTFENHEMSEDEEYNDEKINADYADYMNL